MFERRALEFASSFIDGEVIVPCSSRIWDFVTRDPATNEVFAQVHGSDPEEVERAIASALRAYATWSRLPGRDRGRVLLRAAQLLRERAPMLAELEVRDTGKPIQEALSVDIPSAADALEYFGGIAPTLCGTHTDLGSAFVYTRREPLGVCAGIGAWNYPLQIAAWKAAPALCAGNAMVFKPSELTPVTASELAKILVEAGLPPGVFNVVQGGAAVGTQLTTHPKIRKVSLTGSLATGRRVAHDSADTLKHVTLELGGKSPLIVFADAKKDDAVKAAILANFFTQGEVCSNGTRVFVERSIVKEFIDELLVRVSRLRIGDPLDPSTHVGALISAEHREKVERFVWSGKEEGARLLCGGARPSFAGDEKVLHGGYFYLPTIFGECRDDMTIVREEIFGPVMSILTFDTEEEVIARANGTDYGLAAGVFTRDLARGHRVVRDLEAGVCWINQYNVTPIEVPFGGMKQSGLGRENGMAAVFCYTQEKTVYVELGEVMTPYP